MYADDTTLICHLNDMPLENQSTVLILRETDLLVTNCPIIQRRPDMVFRKKTQVVKLILYMNGSIIDSVENFNLQGLAMSSNVF